MPSRITELDPPRQIAFTWNGSGDVSIDLAPRGDKVLLTLIHRRLPDRSTTLGVSAGWHAHLDVLAARAADADPEPFWDSWTRLRRTTSSGFPPDGLTGASLRDAPDPTSQH